MLSGATPSAAAMVGTAVLRMVVSSDSMKNATATSHGTRRLMEDVSTDFRSVSSHRVSAFRISRMSYARKAELTSLRQGYGGPPKRFARRRKFGPTTVI